MTIATSAAAAIGELEAGDSSTVVVVVESSDQHRLTAIGRHIAVHPVLAFVTFGDEPSSGDGIDPWRVGAHGHFSPDELDIPSIRRAIRYASILAQLTASELPLSPLLNRAAEETRASEVALLMGPDQVVLHACGPLMTLLGHTADRIVGAPGSSWIHPEDGSRFRGALDLAAADPIARPASLLVRAVRATGEERTVEVTVTRSPNAPLSTCWS